MNASESIILSMPKTGRMLCPECSADRTKKDPTLSVTVFDDRHVFHCHHCTYEGIIPHKNIANYVQDKLAERQIIQPPKLVQIPTPINQDSDTVIRDWFQARGVVITDKTVLPNMTTGVKYYRNVGQNLPSIGFIYGTPEQTSAIKWRPLNGKHFTQDGASRTFYGLENITEENHKQLVIVEGEADVVALASVGIVALSCPNGAPKKLSDGRVLPEDDKKYSFVWEARELLEAAEKIILAVDNDTAGDALVEELARRIDRAKCWRTEFPDDCNDPTDTLAAHGAEALVAAIDKSSPMPLKGIYAASEYTSQLFELYEKGHGKGESTGLTDVDELMTIKEGQMTIVTGLPGSGKSEFIDQIVMNLAMQKKWKVAVASFENPPAIHIQKLTEKYTGKPFFKGDTPRMSHREMVDAHAFINDHFCFLENKDGNLSTIDSIINRTKQAVQRLGVRVLIIDPYNYIAPENDDNEHKQVSDLLTKVKAFAEAFSIHVFFIAHPAKMYAREDGTYAVPKGMNISGSAAWFAKADIGVTVHRGGEGVEIHIWKVRFKWIGSLGMCLLDYHIPTGRYADHKIPWGGPPNAIKKRPDEAWGNFKKDDLPF